MSSNADLGRSDPESTTNGASHSGADLAPDLTMVPVMEDPALVSEAGVTSFVAALMWDLISPLKDVTVPAPEPVLP